MHGTEKELNNIAIIKSTQYACMCMPECYTKVHHSKFFLGHCMVVHLLARLSDQGKTKFG